MNTTLLLTAIFIQSSDAQAVSQLFDVLDKNGDGFVSSSEISDSQRTYFQRALRVSDQNEDGKLSRQELSFAVSDPKRVEISSRRGSGTPSFDIERLDKNKDGFISKDEIPTAFQARFKRILDRTGGERVEVKDAKRYLSYSQDMNAAAKTDSKMKDSDSPRMTPEMKPGSASGRNRTAGQSRDIFKRLDQDMDGKLTGSEIPQRMRQFIRRFDTNNDRSISLQEFARMAASQRSR